jgi:hypothetical protein
MGAERLVPGSDGLVMPQLTLDARVVVIDIVVLPTFVRTDRCYHGYSGNCGSCDEIDCTIRQPVFSRDQLGDWGADYGGHRRLYAKELWDDTGKYRVRGIPMSREEYVAYRKREKVDRSD